MYKIIKWMYDKYNVHVFKYVCIYVCIYGIHCLNIIINT